MLERTHIEKPVETFPIMKLLGNFDTKNFPRFHDWAAAFLTTVAPPCIKCFSTNTKPYTMSPSPEQVDIEAVYCLDCRFARPISKEN